jgi:hypothetical protein
MKAKPRPYTIRELRDISAARVARVPWSQLESRYGRSETAMRQACRRHGLPLGPQGRPPRSVTASPDEVKVRQALALRNNGASWPEAARAVGWEGRDPGENLRKVVKRYADRLGGRVRRGQS